MTDITWTGYGLGGIEVPHDSPDCLAAFGKGEGEPRYLVKAASEGPTKGHLFNPHDPYYEPAAGNRVWSHSGRARFEMKRVSKPAFEAYLRFLETDNTRHLYQAERM